MNLPFIFLFQYFVMQFGVSIGMNRETDFHTLKNNISDLGNEDLVGPTVATIANASFIISSILIIFGCIIAFNLIDDKLWNIGLALMILSGVGSLLVGLFPENTIGFLHYTGALLVFIFGNISIILLGLATKETWITVLGGISLGFLPLFTLGKNLKYRGLIERIISFPQTLSLIYLGFKYDI